MPPDVYAINSSTAGHGTAACSYGCTPAAGQLRQLPPLPRLPLAPQPLRLCRRSFHRHPAAPLTEPIQPAAALSDRCRAQLLDIRRCFVPATQQDDPADQPLTHLTHLLMQTNVTSYNRTLTAAMQDPGPAANNHVSSQPIDAELLLSCAWRTRGEQHAHQFRHTVYQDCQLARSRRPLLHIL